MPTDEGKPRDEQPLDEAANRGSGAGAPKEADSSARPVKLPSAQEAIAQRRAMLRAKLQQKADESAGDQEATPGASRNQGLSLQDIIDRQRTGQKSQPPPAAPPRAKKTPPPSTNPPAAPKRPQVREAPPASAPKVARAQRPAPNTPDDASPRPAPAAMPASPGRQKLTYAILVTNTFLLAVVGGVLVYTLSRSSGRPSSVDAAMTAVRTLGKGKPAPQKPRTNVPDANEPGAVTAAAVTAPSWSAAEAAFAKKDYDRALARYTQLLLASRREGSESLCGDFFQYRMAQSMWHLGRSKQARGLLEKLGRSDSPIVRAASQADLARMDETTGQHLQARVLAYRALAALKATEEPLALEADCDYLIARALTQKVNSFYSTEAIVPWSRLRTSDVFAGRTDRRIRRMLEEGAAGPGRSKASDVRIVSTPRAWTLTCTRVALEDVLHQFASKTGKDVEWRDVSPAVRRRSVGFRFREVSEQRACELACGLAGLVARFTWDQIIVCDPQPTTLSDQKDLLAAEALATWRRFSLRNPDDDRAPEAHFARAALYERAGDTVGAMKQYQLIGRQYRHELELAPRALMRSAELRVSLRDYAGARADLQDVLDLYPRYPRTDRVYLSLGQVGMQAGQGETQAAEREKHLETATKAYLRVHELNASAESRAEACLGAGDCYYRQGRYKKASTWLSRYITLAPNAPREGRARAYLLLGRSELAQGNRNLAAESFRRALAARPLRDQYVEAVLALAKVQAEMGDFVRAMATLQRIEKEKLSGGQRHHYMVAVSELYRAMALPDRARAFLRKTASSVSDPQLKAQLAVERARCLWQVGDLQAARRTMSKALGQLPAGPVAWAASLDLGRLCMAMDDPEQAVVFAREVLRGKCPQKTRREALEILGQAYLRCKEYGKAVRALAQIGGVRPAPASTEGKSK